MGYVYMLKNKINGKIYIGQTIRPIKRRLEEHRSGESSKCRALYSAIKKHGWDNFEKDYYECPDEDLNFDEELLVREMMTISTNGYNLREGGGSRGKHSKESKQKMRIATLGKKRSEETKQRCKEAKTGKNNPNYGKTQSDDSNRKRSEKMTGEHNHMYGKTGEKHHNSKRIYQYELDGTFIDSFASGKEAGLYFEKDASSIKACARGSRRHKTAYKFKWSYTFPFV
jgi:group I intron endonuclease